MERQGGGQAGHWAWVGMWVALVCVGVLTGAGSLGAAPAYPVKVGPTGRYLVDQNGVPFLIAGESPQAMIGDLSEGEAEVFLASRRAHGFNTLWINLLCNSYTGCHADGSTRDGIPPFTTPGDFATPNEAYFARADRMLQLAAQYGFLVILDPAETGGWLNVMRSNGVDKCRAYGQFVGGRYASFDNIVWMHGNDFQEWGPVFDPAPMAVAQGIRDADNRHIHTVQLNFFTSGSLDDAAWAPLIELNASYTYFPTYQQVLKDYNRANFLPVFMVEGSYEFEENAPGITPRGIPQVLRRQAYWSNLSGATGQVYGNKYTWQFIDGWQEQLDTPGAVQMAYVTALFESRKWYELVPDQTHNVVTAGFGTFGADDYVTAARTPSGELAMAYVPSARTVTVDLSVLSGPVTARWYDPTTGTFTTIPGSPFVNAGLGDFTTPGNNADGPGNEDWVLVLEVFPPSPPSNLHAASVSSTEIDLAWTFLSGDAEGFRLERRTGTAGDFAQIAVIAGGLRSYSDTGRTQGTTYFYQVRAFNVAGDSEYSNEDSATTLAPGIDVQPASWDYGSVERGETAGKDFSVTNTGSATLNVSSATLLGSGGEFAVVGGGGAFTLAAGEARNVRVTYSPTTTGVMNATLRLVSDDSQHNLTDIPITGTGAVTSPDPTHPDLVETSVGVSPSTGPPGGKLRVTDVVRNRGGLQAGASKTRYYLTLTPVRDAAARLLTEVRAVPTLVPNAVSAGAMTVTIPLNIPLGTYYLLVCADDTGLLVTETDKSNNCQAAATRVQVTQPDLVATAVSNPPGVVAPGGSFRVSDTVTNQGAVAAPGSTTRYYLASDQQKGTGDVLLSGGRAVPGLPAGGAWQGAATAVGVPAATPLGLYYLLVCANDTGLVTETDKSNNCRAAATRVQVTRPDLVPTAVSNPPEAMAPGGSFWVTDTVANQGAVAATRSTTRYYLAGSQQKRNGDALLSGSRGVPGLTAGAEWPGVAIAVGIPAATPLGLYYLLVCANDTDLVTETDKSNNCRAAATRVQVTRPDLVPTAVSNPPGAVAPGGRFQVSDTVTNQGAVAATGSSTRYYLAGNQQRGNGDVLLSGSRGVPGLAAGAAWPGAAITVGVPVATPLGLYYLLACSNDTDLVAETDKSNNCQAAATQMQVTLTP